MLTNKTIIAIGLATAASMTVMPMAVSAIEALLQVAQANPCAADCSANSCAAANPCGPTNPCAAANPCAADSGNSLIDGFAPSR